uniref:sodium-coupled monocarboxylate transporter 1-like n=1 Tax=Styela clava TaxID=7725 RepID=UPI001939EFF1|nr:sodium-coupled monocarboxylate transporter 1-like [Styela clava]
MQDQNLFRPVDYVVFGVMLIISLAIGIYYSWKDRSTKDKTRNYLIAGSNMNSWAAGMSLSFTVISPTTILAIPAEIYIFGSMFIWLVVAAWIVGLFTISLYIPLFFRLNITSIYEYLQLRYSYPVRILGTIAFIVQTTMYIGVMVYTPALAFTQVSGFNLWAAIFTTGIVCTAYTTVGGLKAVIWTDVFQGVVIMIIQVIVLFMSASYVGGWKIVWEANSKTDRFNFFDSDFDPRTRHTVWSLLIGLTILWLSIYATSQSQAQRFLACKSAKSAKKAMIFSDVVISFVVLLSVIIGWVTYAAFHNCDPILTKQVTAPDQLLPFMVTRVFQLYPGLSGAFLAAVYAGSLSTLSSGINAMACVTTEDLIRPFVRWSDSTMIVVAKALACFYGFCGIGFACMCSILGNILQTSLTLLGILGGPTLGMYTMGAVFPLANSWGASIGFISGVSFSSWIYAGSRHYPPQLKYWKPKYRSTSECVSENDVESTFISMINTTMKMTNTSPFLSETVSNTAIASIQPYDAPRPALANLYDVSYLYYAPIGLAVTLVVGLFVSALTCKNK